METLEQSKRSTKIWTIALFIITMILLHSACEYSKEKKWVDCMNGTDGSNLECHECDSLYNPEGKYKY